MTAGCFPASLNGMWTTIISGAVIAASALSGSAAHSAPAAPDLPGIGPLIDRTISAQLAADKIPGAAVVVVAGGKTVVAKGYGVSDVAERTPVDPVRTEFFTGSIAKVFTATAVAQLVTEGKIDPKAPVNTYLKDFKIRDTYPGRPVTIENLMTHTAGFDDEPLGVAVRDPKDVPKLGQYLADHEPLRVRAPGTLAAYDNYGVALAGYVVESVSGEPFAQYMQEHVFGPLQMADSTFAQPHPAGVDANLAKGYRPDGGGQTAEAGQYGAWAPTGAGTVATATDVAKFMTAQLSDDPSLGAGVAELMQKQQFTMDPRLPGMAYLFEERPRDGQQILFKDGDVPGFHANLALLPKQGIGIYVVYNGDGTDGTAAWDGKALINTIVDQYFPDAGAVPVVGAPVPGPKAGAYAGTYRSDRVSRGDVTRVAGLVGAVTVEAHGDGTLTTDGLSQNPHAAAQHWYPLGNGEFAEQGGPDRLIFDGRGHLATSIDPTVAYYRLGWYASPRLHLPMLYTGAGILAAALLGFPVLALVRRLRGRAAHPRWARNARVLAGVAGALATTFTIGFLAMTGDGNAFDETVLLGSSWLTALLVLNALLAVSTIGLIAGTAAAWRLSWWRPAGRIAYTLTTLGAVSFLTVAYTYNLVWP
ncbi:serine hydrolase [Catenulispora yoronensis]|uniref:Serine hydrolase n=2 Tax=Catenulispora yoronensis TaxID=450799 RepID=A0ABP5GUG1_9ACTN